MKKRGQMRLLEKDAGKKGQVSVFIILIVVVFVLIFLKRRNIRKRKCV